MGELDETHQRSLDGKVALITGAASGIGRATAELFAAEGAKLCLVDVDEAGEALAVDLGAVFVHADVGDPGDNDAAFARAADELGGLDVAFLNAGIALGLADVTEVSDDEYRRIMRVNVDGVLYGLRAAVRIMREGGGGAIVATASLAGIIPFPLDPIYDATKHAVVGLIRSVAPTLAAQRITANTVNPGMTDTNILTPDARAFLEAAQFPLMPPAQIAQTVLGIVTGGRSGECWVCQPGLASTPYEFRGVPGPRGEGEGVAPPGIWEGRWASEG